MHAEWTLAYRAEMAFRVYEYDTLHNLALAADAKALGKTPPPIESIVVVLSGPKRPLPAFGEYRTSPQGKPFSGVRFRIEQVYLRTIAELRATGSPLWMIFAFRRTRSRFGFPRRTPLDAALFTVGHAPHTPASASRPQLD